MIGSPGNHRTFSLALIGALVVGWPSLARAASEYDLERIRARGEERLQEWLERGRSPGLSAAVVLPDGQVVAFAAGVREEDEDGGGEPVRVTDRFLAGSTGKTFVSGLILRLATEGRLSLDDRAGEWLEDPDWLAEVPNGTKVTIRQLLSHRTGIPRYVFDPRLWSDLLSDPDRLLSPESCLARLAGQAPLFPPGEGFAYADSNYLILGRVIEAVTGEDFYSLVRARWLAPAKLDGVIPQDAREIDQLIQGHSRILAALGVPPKMLDADGRLPFHPGFEWCGGGFATTPTDLARYAGMLFSGAEIGEEALGWMLNDPADASAELGPGTRYGLGVILRDTELGPMRGHDGVFPGYLTAMAFFPERRIAAAAQWNTDGPIGGAPHALLVELAQEVEKIRSAAPEGEKGSAGG